MRLLVISVAMALAVASCSGNDDAQEPSETYELSCETFVSLHGDPTESFEGYVTPREAVATWIPGTPGGLPQGDWIQYENSKWILVDEEGNTIGRTEVMVLTGNANTTFATERYASFGIEYCE